MEELFQDVDRQLGQFGDGASADFHVAGFRAQTCAVALRASGLPLIACQHDPVLYFV